MARQKTFEYFVCNPCDHFSPYKFDVKGKDGNQRPYFPVGEEVDERILNQLPQLVKCF